MRLLRKPAYLGLVWLALGATPGRSAEMTFNTVAYGSGCKPSCPRLIQANGPITGETPQAFLDFARREIDRPGLMNVMLIHSHGGSVSASMKLGKILRNLGTVVIVARSADSADRKSAKPTKSMNFISGTCASACVYTLAGGKIRVVPPESRVAVHRMAGNISSFDWGTREMAQKRVYAGTSELATLTGYIRDMGVSTELVGMAESIPHEHARVLSTKEISRLNLGLPKF